MLVNELSGDGTLFIGQAAPRAWLAEGKRITVERAPTFFGPVSLQIESAAARGALTARIEFIGDRRPTTLIVRFRHPDTKPIRSATVNGAVWTDFDVAKEWIRLVHPAEPRYTILARY
jgi:hypothetical protein